MNAWVASIKNVSSANGRDFGIALVEFLHDSDEYGQW